MPKSSTTGWPSALTRMFAGFRSQWTIGARCAAATASQTFMNSATRARRSRRFRSRYSVSGRPSQHIHHEVRHARSVYRRRTTRDAGMIDTCEQPALAREPFERCRGNPVGPNTLTATCRSKGPVDASCEENRAHAAAAQLADDLVGAEADIGPMDSRASTCSPPSRRSRRPPADGRSPARTAGSPPQARAETRPAAPAAVRPPHRRSRVYVGRPSSHSPGV